MGCHATSTLPTRKHCRRGNDALLGQAHRCDLVVVGEFMLEYVSAMSIFRGPGVLPPCNDFLFGTSVVTFRHRSIMSGVVNEATWQLVETYNGHWAERILEHSSVRKTPEVFKFRNVAGTAGSWRACCSKINCGITIELVVFLDGVYTCEPTMPRCSFRKKDNCYYRSITIPVNLNDFVLSNSPDSRTIFPPGRKLHRFASAGLRHFW